MVIYNNTSSILTVFAAEATRDKGQKDPKLNMIEVVKALKATLQKFDRGHQGQSEARG